MAKRWASPAPFMVLAITGVVSLALILVAIFAIATTNAANEAEVARLEKAAAELRLQLAADAAIERERQIDATCERAQSEFRAATERSEQLTECSQQLLSACQLDLSQDRVGRVTAALALIDVERKTKRVEEERQAQAAMVREANMSCGEADAMQQAWEYLRTTRAGFVETETEVEMVDRVLERCVAEFEANAQAEAERIRAEF